MSLDTCISVYPNVKGQPPGFAGLAAPPCYRYSGCIVEAGGEESDGAARRSRLPSLVVVVSSRFHEPNTHRPATNLD
jgi:hypothetical protein